MCNPDLGQTLCGSLCCVEDEWCNGSQCIAIFPSATTSLEATKSLSSTLPTIIAATSSSSSPASRLISSSSTFSTQSSPSLTLSTQLSTGLTSQSPSSTTSLSSATTLSAIPSPSSSSSNLSVGAIVGIVISAVAGAAILFLTGYFLARWRKRAGQSTERLEDDSGVPELVGAEVHEIAEPEVREVDGAEIHEIAEPDVREIAGAEVFPARPEAISVEDAATLEGSKTGTARE